MAGKCPQLSHESPFQAEGLSELIIGTGQRDKGLMAEGSNSLEPAKVPRHPV